MRRHVRLVRKAVATAVHALLWAAKDEIPLTRGFPDCAWVEAYCKRRAVWVVQNNDEIAGAMILPGK
jgi:hypothetical protein